MKLKMMVDLLDLYLLFIEFWHNAYYNRFGAKWRVFHFLRTESKTKMDVKIVHKMVKTDAFSTMNFSVRTEWQAEKQLKKL